MQQYDPFIGKELGNYLIQSRLGEGGMARVYKAYHARLRRDVAIKVITPTAQQRAEQSDFQVRFEREAQVVASLEHRNIVAIYDFSTHEDLTYLVMQYVGGGTLRDLLRREGMLDPRHAANYMLQMARALHHAHQRGIVHRDVKPQNMLISASDPHHLLLSDFGIAKSFVSDLDIPDISHMATAPIAPSTLTSTGMFIGTAAYMAPEQALRHPLDARTDVYSLGVVLYQLLSGSLPFKANSQYGLLVQHVMNQPKPLRELNPNIPEAMAYITEKALQKNPADRFQSAEEMAQALEAALASGMTTPFSGIPNPRNGAGSVTPRLSGRPATSGPGSRPTPATSLNMAPFQTPSAVRKQSGSSYATPSAPSQHAAKRPRKFFSLYTLATAAVLILAVVLLVRNLAPNVFNPLSQQPDLTNTPIQHFVDTFANDDHQWVTQDPGLIARVEKHLLDLQTSDNNQHLPHPAASVTGKLPQNFTYTVTMTAVEADATAFTYGIAFRLHPSGQRLDQGYAFFVSTQGYYALWKYAQAPPSGQLFTGSLTNLKGLGKENTLAVKVQGHTLSFVVNGKAVPLSGGQPTFTDQNALQDGLPGIYIAGTGTHVRVSRVEIVTSNAG